VVFGGRPLGQIANVGDYYIDVDNRLGGEQATAHLIDRGYRRIATITGPPDMSPGIDRLNGYRDALARAGFAVDADLEATGDFTRESGARAMRGILDRCPDVDALFAASDLMAVGALSELRRRGRRVPEDVAVVGYDDSAIAAAAQPPLSSVRQPIEEMGREMTRLLLQAIETRSATQKRVLLGTSLTIRQSTIGGDA
jgi:DNA-binding LacI/PurR family transcriptional regulator